MNLWLHCYLNIAPDFKNNNCFIIYYIIIWNKLKANVSQHIHNLTFKDIAVGCSSQ